MPTVCDHTSVGILVYRSDKLLLIERKKPPFGMAPPAGHVDRRSSFELAAIEELHEEVGLVATALTLVTEGRRENPCRRVGGSWHYWKIYEAVTTGDPQPSVTEVKNFCWATQHELSFLASRAKDYLNHTISETDWRDKPGLEPVWLEWLTELGKTSIHN